MISTMIDQAILTNGEIAFDAVNPTVKELLTLANQEKKVEGPIGMCGSKCDDSCDTCKTYSTLLTEHFKEQEEKEEEEENFCASCGSECVSYTIHWDGQEEVHWMCERCYYYGQEDWLEYGGGLEWNESGYFD